MTGENRVTKQATHLAGLINAVAGVCVGLAYFLHPHHATPDVVVSGFWLGIHVLFATSLLGGIFGALGIFAHHSSRTGWTGLVGMVLIVTSLTLIFGLNYWEAFIIPLVAAEAPGFVRAHGAGEAMGMVASRGRLVDDLWSNRFRRRSKWLFTDARGQGWCSCLCTGAGLAGPLPLELQGPGYRPPQK